VQAFSVSEPPLITSHSSCSAASSSATGGSSTTGGSSVAGGSSTAAASRSGPASQSQSQSNEDQLAQIRSLVASMTGQAPAAPSAPGNPPNLVHRPIDRTHANFRAFPGRCSHTSNSRTHDHFSPRTRFVPLPIPPSGSPSTTQHRGLETCHLIAPVPSSSCQPRSSTSDWHAPRPRSRSGSAVRGWFWRTAVPSSHCRPGKKSAKLGGID
jgi:hypothetical protein